MTRNPTPKPLAMRELRGVYGLVALWVMIWFPVGIAGPFGTFEVLTIVPRFGYWALVVAASIVLSIVASRITKGRHLAIRFAGELVFTLVMSLGVLALNYLTFGTWNAPVTFWFLFWNIAVIDLAIFLVVRLFTNADEAPTQNAAEEIAPEARFLRRMPLEKRGDLVRIEAQDHYLNVVTTQGQALVLMRLSDAEAELRSTEGSRIHRSHWIKHDQVAKHIRRDMRSFLLMSDGAEVPISRSYRDAIKRLGLL